MARRGITMVAAVLIIVVGEVMSMLAVLARRIIVKYKDNVFLIKNKICKSFIVGFNSVLKLN